LGFVPFLNEMSWSFGGDGVTYVDIYACVFLANYLNTATTTAIFTGWLGLALILGLIYWENGERWDEKEGREKEKMVMVSYIGHVWDGTEGLMMMEWDETKGRHETRSIGRKGRDLIHHLELERERGAYFL
jgi:hypothetical protein